MYAIRSCRPRSLGVLSLGQTFRWLYKIFLGFFLNTQNILGATTLLCNVFFFLYFYYYVQNNDCCNIIIKIPIIQLSNWFFDITQWCKHFCWHFCEFVSLGSISSTHLIKVSIRSYWCVVMCVINTEICTNNLKATRVINKTCLLEYLSIVVKHLKWQKLKIYHPNKILSSNIHCPE